MPIICKLYRCFGQSEDCMWLRYNSQVSFVTLHKLNLVILWALLLSKWTDSGYLVCATPPTILRQFFWNLKGAFFMVWRCACGFIIIILRLFCHFFNDVNLDMFRPSMLSMPLYVSCLVRAYTPTVLYSSFYTSACVYIMAGRLWMCLGKILRLSLFSLFSVLWT